MKSHNCTHIILEEKKNKQLTDKSLKKLLNRVIDYMESEFGLHATNEEMTVVSHRIIQLFPSLKIEKSDCGGIVSNLFMFFSFEKS